MHWNDNWSPAGLVFCRQVLEPGDEEWLFSGMEHHSNIVPWQEACEDRGKELVYAYLEDDVG